jgi:hypothetical protein
LTSARELRDLRRTLAAYREPDVVTLVVELQCDEPEPERDVLVREAAPGCVGLAHRFTRASTPFASDEDA